MRDIKETVGNTLILTLALLVAIIPFVNLVFGLITVNVYEDETELYYGIFMLIVFILEISLLFLI